MSVPEPNGPRWQLQDHERRLQALEAAKVDVLANRLGNVEKTLGTLNRWLITLVVMVASGVIIGVILSARGHS